MDELLNGHCRTQSNKLFLLDIEADDLKEVDIAGLEAEAITEKGSVAPASPLPPSSPPQSSPVCAVGSSSVSHAATGAISSA